jgi:hypothetical protein
MRILADIIAVIIAAFGAMFLVASWLVAGSGRAGEIFVVGVLLVLIGVILPGPPRQALCVRLRKSETEGAAVQASSTSEPSTNET